MSNFFNKLKNICPVNQQMKFFFFVLKEAVYFSEKI